MFNCYGDHCVEDLLTASSQCCKTSKSCLTRLQATQSCNRTSRSHKSSYCCAGIVCLLKFWFFVAATCLMITELERMSSFSLCSTVVPVYRCPPSPLQLLPWGARSCARRNQTSSRRISGNKNVLKKFLSVL